MKNLFLVAFILLFFSCKSTYQTQTFQPKNTPSIPDYKQEASWAVLPTNYNEELKKYSPDQTAINALKADVFYIYPTLNTDKKDIRWNVPINDKEQQEKVLNTSVKYQASPFATSGKIYVPYYRQAHVRSYTLLNEGGKEALEIAYSDVKNAFKIYLEKYNNGRPIIIASHSQGTTHSRRLLKEFFDEKPLQKQLIAAYLVGMGVKSNEFKSIKPMYNPDETGGFVSWNTYKKGKFPKNKGWYKGSVTTNPITWNNAKTTTLEQHKGFLYTNDKLYKNALTIEITDGLVWSTNPKFPMRFFMSFLKNYHAGDINLFWEDIKQNIELRTSVWLSNKK